MPTREQKSALTRIERIIQNATEARDLLLADMEEQEVEEEEDEVTHAEYDKAEKGFVCLAGRKKLCKESVFTAGEMVAHLRDEHDIDPDDAMIDGWTARHDKQWAKYLEAESEDEEDEDEAYTKAELKDMSNAELKEILDDADVEYPAKAKKTALAKLVLDSQSEEEEEDDEADDDDEEGYTMSELKKMQKVELRGILDEWRVPYRKKDNMTTLRELILNPPEDEDEEDEEGEEDFTPYKLKSKAVTKWRKDNNLQSDEMKLIVEYANEEEVSLEDAAEEFELVDTDED